LFSIWIPAHLDAQRLANQMLERDGVPVGRPQLQLRLAGRAQLQQGVLATIVEIDAGDDL